jgi:uncharacterized membrane-anchored protein
MKSRVKVAMYLALAALGMQLLNLVVDGTPFVQPMLHGSHWRTNWYIGAWVILIRSAAIGITFLIVVNNFKIWREARLAKFIAAGAGIYVAITLVAGVGISLFTDWTYVFVVQHDADYRRGGEPQQFAAQYLSPAIWLGMLFAVASLAIAARIARAEKAKR